MTGPARPPQHARTPVLEARGIRVAPASTHGLDLLPATDLVVHGGETVVVAGDPGPGHMLLALALGGRLGGLEGEVTLDGDPARATLQQTVVLVDVPGVTEPDAAVPVHTVVAEELAMAGRPASRRAVGPWLEERGIHPHAAVEELTADQRIGLLTALARLRAPRFVVLTLPERLGGLPADWADHLQRLTDDGIGVVVTASHGLLPHYPSGRTTTIGGAEQPEDADDPDDPQEEAP